MFCGALLPNSSENFWLAMAPRLNHTPWVEPSGHSSSVVIAMSISSLASVVSAPGLPYIGWMRKRYCVPGCEP